MIEYKGKNEVKIWSNEVEYSVMEQIKNLSELPFIFKHIAIMPDNHAGFGCPIGTVVATKDIIIPAIVGVDIGCGMCAVKTSLTEIDTETLKKIMGEIRKKIPVGFSHQQEEQNPSWLTEGSAGLEYGDLPVVSGQYKSALKQIGTLGGGNHFIEIQKGSDGHIWIMIHSGSRNLGKQVADHYNKIAIDLNKKWHSAVPEEWELAFLPVDSEEGQAYLREMQYCVDFALENRKLMMDRILSIFKQTIPEFYFINFINIAHNYVALEHHMGHDVWVHRKGATKADTDTIGIIPGSQGTKSYIVKGKGNILSFKSCSHGAGRKMGRNEAIRNLNLEEEIKRLDEQGIVHSIRHQNDLDEASGAYKDINIVMRNQEDLVEVLVELQPLAVING